MKQYFPFLLPGDSTRRDVLPDFMSALAVTFMAVPQGVAYAVIAFAAGHGFVCGFYPMHCGWFDAEFQTRHHWSDQRIVTVSSGRCGRDDASRSL